MTERPIIFSGDSVRAIIAGAKTQTRRLVTVPWRGSQRALPYEPWYVSEDGRLLVDCSEADDSHGNGDYREFTTCQRHPYGRAGDRLWVRETWSWDAEYEGPGCVSYRARDDERQGQRWRSPIHMPRWASRLLLTVTEVRVERLQSITEEDAEAEGVAPYKQADLTNVREVAAFFGSGPAPHLSYRAGFANAWDSLNGKRAPWAENPWVWVVTFRRETT